MIQYLRVRNLAIVQEFSIELGPGFNVLTGETGAGKSLLIDSLQLLSGARSSTDSIRTGEEKLQAEAVFDLAPALIRAAREAGVPDLDEPDPQLVIRRELNTSGRGRVTLNGSPFTVRELAELMDPLLEIHGQDGSRGRIAGQSIRDVLDHFAGLTPLREKSSGLLRSWEAAAAELERLRHAERDRDQRLDVLRFQIEELAAAQISPGEEETLRQERAMLANADSLMKATAAAWALLEEDENAVSSSLSRAIHLLTPLTAQVDELRTIVEQLEQSRIALAEGSRELEHFASTIRHDPERLDQVEERLALLERLERKYGAGESELATLLERLTIERDEIEDSTAHIERAGKEEEAAFAKWREIADELSRRRKESAPQLATAIRRELDELAMEGTHVQVLVERSADAGSRLKIGAAGVAFGPAGYDRVDILIAPNRGEEPKPLTRVASGGELSRIQLAIAAAMFRRRSTAGGTTLVFDEIDTGVGGRVAEAIGRKLQELAAGSQVLCVTHLPQIAALGDTHFRVWKDQAGERTTARIQRLDDPEERVMELARMLGGAAVGDSARRHAQELLSTSARGPLPSTREG